MVTFASPDKRRPALILTRPTVLARIDEVNVVVVTSTIRGLPTEVLLDVDDGMKHACCVNLHQVHTIRRALIRTYVSMLSAAKMRQVCKALHVAMGCVSQPIEPGTGTGLAF
jgi:mRNA interferase MazF